MSEQDEKAQLKAIQSTLDTLQVEYEKGEIDISRYLKLKTEYETRKAKLEQELGHSPLAYQAAHLNTSAMTRIPIEPEMVTVPGGPFLMGTSEAQLEDMLARFEWARELQEEGWFARELLQRELTLPAFEIGRYPVTNAEYVAFVAADGHTAPAHWGGQRPPDELFAHPVVNVSWHDALAYVTWLSERTGRPYRLPTEAEWEKAARGGDGRLWPWGDDWDAGRASCKPAESFRTTPVDQYSPAGDSPYGCADVAGNAREWCSSLWGDDLDQPSFAYPYRADDGRENLESGGLRILRGGSWRSSSLGIVRCAYRYWVGPDVRYDFYGFRVARGTPG
jgi:formylglycine-generating enzyme required for sulfatase activity